MTRSERRRSSDGERPGERRDGILDLLFILALCVLLVFGVVRPFVAEVFRIPSGSMTPTLQVHDRVLTVKFAYRLGEPERGDLAVFEAPDGEINIKRIVALGGDSVEIRDGMLQVNRDVKREPYVDYERADSTFYGPTRVPEGTVFMLGDNRTNSIDSRSYGPVSEDELLGEVVLRLWPLHRVGSF